MLKCQNCVLFIDDFHTEKAPKSEGRKFYIIGSKHGNQGRSMTTDVSGDNRKGRRLSKIMRQMVLGESKHPALTEAASECVSAYFHKGVKDLIVLAFSKEVLLVDIKLCQALGAISLERVHSPLAGLRTCSDKDRIFILHESGSISVWNRKESLSVMSTPSINRSQTLIGFARTPVTANKDEDGYAIAGSDALLEVSYESKVP